MIFESGLFMEGSGTSSTPTLYYRDSVTLSLDQNTQFAKLIPAATLKIYPGGSHGLADTRKDDLNAELYPRIAREHVGRTSAHVSVHLPAHSTRPRLDSVGDAAMRVDATDEMAMGKALIHLDQDAGLRDSLRLKGFERIKVFSWKETARKTAEVYEKALEEK